MVLELMTMMALGGAPTQPVATKTAMHEAFDALTMLVWLTSPRASTVDQKEAIAAQLQKLDAVPHAFDGPKLKQEPGIAAVASLFKGYVGTTRARFEAGEVDTVGFRVRTMAGLCFACHTREQVPADFPDIERRFESLSLTPMERAQALAATRQFDRAIELYRGVIDDPAAPWSDVSRAMDDLLIVLVRAKGDAAVLQTVLTAVSGRKDLPASEKATVEAWLAEVKAWQADTFNAKTASADALIAKAEALVKQGGDVSMLRASALLSRALSLKPTHPKRGRALYLLGVSAKHVRSTLLWDLDLLYFEACIRENAKKPIAKECFAAFNEQLVEGFSGSGGTRIPPDEQARLEQLKALAGVK